MKLITTLSILVITPALFASELPVSYNGGDCLAKVHTGALLPLSGPLQPIRNFRTTIKESFTLQSPPPASSPWSGAVYYSVCRDDFAAVVMNRIDTWEKPFHLPFNIDFSGFTGPSMKGEVLAGGAATVGFDVTAGVRFNVGAAFDGAITDLRHVGFGPILSIAYSRSFNTGSATAGERKVLFGPKDLRF